MLLNDCDNIKVEKLSNQLIKLIFYFSLELGADLDKKTDLLLDQIAGMKSPSSSMGTVSKISTAEESRIIGGVPSPTDFPEREEDYNWRTSKINISGNRELLCL